VWPSPAQLKKCFSDIDTSFLEKWKKLFLEEMEITISNHSIVKKIGPVIPLVDSASILHFGGCNTVSVM
jgi:hypothetical protein